MPPSPTILMVARATDRFFTDEDADRFLTTGMIFCTGTTPPPRPAVPVILPRFVRRMEQARRLQTATAR